MSLSAKEAAEQVGMSKQGIIKAINQGKLSATKDVNGQWQIEPVELFRVYPPVKEKPVVVDDAAAGGHLEQLERELQLLRERLADKDDVIMDLRRRLDNESDERRKLTMILTDESHTRQTTRDTNFFRRFFPRLA